MTCPKCKNKTIDSNDHEKMRDFNASKFCPICALTFVIRTGARSLFKPDFVCRRSPMPWLFYIEYRR